MTLEENQKYEHSRQRVDTQKSKHTRDRVFDGAALLAYLLPKNLLSWITGALVRVRWPRPFRNVIHQGFINIFKINMDEAQDPVSSFASIEAIFTRALRSGARKIQGGFVSPADGFLVRSEPLKNNQAVQAKGLDYSVADLIGVNCGAIAGARETEEGASQGRPSDRALDQIGAWYFTIYLAPHNYHRVHAPCSGVLTRVGHIPGELWPVNGPFVDRIPKLFNRNERLIFRIKTPEGGNVWLVMVGAFNVGRMTSPFAPFLVTNSDFGCGEGGPRWMSLGQTINVGDELGTFMLGSTVILVLDKNAVQARGGEECLVATAEKTMVQMGQSLVRGIHD